MKKTNKKLSPEQEAVVKEAADRLALIFVMQIEEMRRKKRRSGSGPRLKKSK